MNPAFLAFLLPDELVEGEVLDHPEIPLAEFRGVGEGDVGSLTGEVLGAFGSANSAVELLATVA